MNIGGFSQYDSDTKASPLFASGLGSGPSVLNANVKVRLAFLRKVYGILSAQLGLTALISVAIMVSPKIHGFVYAHPSLLFVNFFANLISVFALIYKRNETPLNFYLLGAFTVFNSFSLGILISLYDAMIVVQAFCLTTVIVVALTLYTFNTKRDLSFMGGTLSTLLLVSVIGGFMHMFFGNSSTETVLTLFGAFVFSAYIIYDTHIIMKHLSAEEYIVAVINLYLDIINLFIKILKLLDKLKNSQENSNDKKKRR